jgi:penicillin-binding protein 1A
MAENKISFWLWYFRKRVVDYYLSVNLWFRKAEKKHPIKYKISWYASGFLNLVAAGVLGIYIISRPAMQEFSDNVLHKQQLSVTFLDRNGEVIGRRGIRLDDSMQLNDYPKYFIDAVLSTEDRRFYNHFGVDIIGTTRAIVENARGHKSLQGGSSITQQLAKNLFLSNERTLERKIKEVFLALALETNLSKDEILKLYLDRAYMGGGSYGAAEAAKHYFNKSARDLSVSEAAILAGLFKAPSKFSPEANPEESRKRWLTVLSNLLATKSITQQQYDEALLYPPQTNIYTDSTAANYYLDWAWEEIQDLENKGLLGDNKVLKVKTAMDLKIQRFAEETMDKQLEAADDQYNVDQAAMIIMNTDGSVVSMIGGNDYRENAFNRATKAMRQPGSSFKPYVYATAIDAGIIDKDTLVTDKPTCIGNWCPHNYGGRYMGTIPAWQAAANSLNSIPVQLSIELGKQESSLKAGRAKIINMAHTMGVMSELRDSQSLPIGSVEVTPLDQVTGYTTLANGGYRVKPFAVLEVRNSAGDLIYTGQPQKERAISDKVVSNLNFMLNKVVEQGTARAVQIPGQVIAGKTGTTNASRDAWFVGYTGSLVAAIWMGNDDNSSTGSMTGGSYPARTWNLIMTEALKTVPNKAPPFLAEPAPQQAAAKKKAPAAPKQPESQPKEFEPPAIREPTFFERLFGINN